MDHTRVWPPADNWEDPVAIIDSPGLLDNNLEKNRNKLKISAYVLDFLYQFLTTLSSKKC